MRIHAKVDYAIRAMAELAKAGGGPVKAESLADVQQLPMNYLLGVLSDLRRDHLVRSQRGPDGGFVLARPADQISLADIFRAVDGPLADVRGESIRGLSYTGAAEELPRVWMAVRMSLRRVLEHVTVADLTFSTMPPIVEELADEYLSESLRLPNRGARAPSEPE